MQVEATAHKQKKEVDHIRIHKAKNGGHVVEHHHKHFAHPPETHVFGPGDGGKMLAHVGKHMGVPASEEEAGESEHEEY